MWTTVSHSLGSFQWVRIHTLLYKFLFWSPLRALRPQSHKNKLSLWTSVSASLRSLQWIFIVFTSDAQNAVRYRSKFRYLIFSLYFDINTIRHLNFRSFNSPNFCSIFFHSISFGKDRSGPFFSRYLVPLIVFLNITGIYQNDPPTVNGPFGRNHTAYHPRQLSFHNINNVLCLCCWISECVSVSEARKYLRLVKCLKRVLFECL